MIYPTPRAAIFMAIGLPVTLVIAVLFPALWALGAAWIAGLVGLIILDIFLSVPRARMEFDVKAPGSFYIGETEQVWFKYSYGNASPPRAPECRLSVNDRFSVAPSHFYGQAANGAVLAAFDVKTERRGDGEIEKLWTRWQGPLGLIWRQTTEKLSLEIPVVPNTRLVKDKAIEIFSRDATFGQKIQQERGEGTEFDALTEFMPGMDKRAIDWKHSARHRVLLAKEFRTERNHNIVFALDSGHLMCEPIREMTKLDWSLNASLLMAYVSLKIGDRIGYFAFDQKPYFYSQPIAGANSFPHLQRLTSSIDYSHNETNFTLGLSQLAQSLKRRTLIVVFTDFVDTTNAELMIENMGRLLRRHIVIFVTFRDEALEQLASKEPRETDDISRAVIAENLMLERELVIARLRRMGVHIVDVAADQMSNAVLNKYLELKRREAI